MDEPKYLSTSKMSKLLDISDKTLRELRGSPLQEGVHYHYPNGLKDCRWNVKAMLHWMEHSNTSDEAQSVLDSLCA